MSLSRLDRSSGLDLVLCALFALSIAAPACALFVRKERTLALSMENRAPATAPDRPSNAREWLAFPDRFQAYFDDHFGLRGELLGVHATLKLALFGVSPTKAVVVGKNGWLFCAIDSSVEIGRGLDPFRTDELDGWIAALETRRRWLAERGIAYVCAIVPNKETIYPELWPAALNRVGPTRLDELVARAAHENGTRVLDLRTALSAEKRNDAARDPLYYPGDTHWTSRGAWTGCNALLSALEDRFPALEPLGREHFAARAAPVERGDLDREVGRASLLSSMPELVPLEPRRARESPSLDTPGLGVRFVVADPRLPRVLLLHDSFGPKLFPYLSEHCSELVCRSEDSLPEDAIELLKPDAVIQLFTERRLARPPLPPHSELRRWTRGAWDALEKNVKLDLRRPLTVLAARGETTLTRCADGDAGSLVVETKSASDMLATDPIAWTPGAHPLLHVEISAPRATVLCVWYQTRVARKFVPRNGCYLPLPAGRSDLCFEIRVDEVEGPLLIRPGSPGRYVLHALEIAESKP